MIFDISLQFWCNCWRRWCALHYHDYGDCDDDGDDDDRKGWYWCERHVVSQRWLPLIFPKGGSGGEAPLLLVITSQHITLGNAEGQLLSSITFQYNCYSPRDKRDKTPQYGQALLLPPPFTVKLNCDFFLIHHPAKHQKTSPKFTEPLFTSRNHSLCVLRFYFLKSHNL